MSKREAWHDAWSQVDQTEDPRFFVRFLDSTRKAAVRAAHANPRKFFEYLNVQPGDKILEVGCGTGDLLVPLAELVGPEGRVVGVDKSRVLIEEAARRATQAGAKVEFAVGDIQQDVCALNFPSNEFHHTFAVSVWQHLDEAGIAMGEMIRLTRAGGRVTITETDWDTQVVASSDVALTRKIVHFFTDSLANGAIARELPERMRDFKLQEITVTALPSVYTEPDPNVVAWLVESARRAAKAGLVTSKEAQGWINGLEYSCENGRYFSAFTSYRVSGKKVEASPPYRRPAVVKATVAKRYK